MSPTCSALAVLGVPDDQDKCPDEPADTPEGFGPDEPVGDNKTAKGRAENRRIEFKVSR